MSFDHTGQYGLSRYVECFGYINCSTRRQHRGNPTIADGDVDSSTICLR
jgi:hypothetical protein